MGKFYVVLVALFILLGGRTGQTVWSQEVYRDTRLFFSPDQWEKSKQHIPLNNIRWEQAPKDSPLSVGVELTHLGSVALIKCVPDVKGGDE